MIKQIYDLQINDELDSLFPKPSDQELKLLEKSIMDEGCTDPIIVWNGIIVDGHNRYRICRKNNIPFAIEEKNFPDMATAMEWMISRQLGRRNLTNYMKAIVALRYEDKFRIESEKNQKAAIKLVTDKGPNERRTDQRLGELVGLSRDTIAKCRKLAAKADDETKAMLEDGAISINKAIKSLGAVTDSKQSEDQNKKHKTKREATRSHEGPLTGLFSGMMRKMFEAQAEMYEEWSGQRKRNVSDQELIGRDFTPKAEVYAFLNTIKAVGEGMKDSREITLSEKEQQVISAFEEILKSLDIGIQEVLNSINSYSAHRALFIAMIRKLSDAYIKGSTDVFDYLDEMEVINTLRFGNAVEDGKSHDEMMREEKERKQSRE